MKITYLQLSYGSGRTGRELGGGAFIPTGLVPIVPEELDEDGFYRPIVLELGEPWVLLPHLWEDYTGCQQLRRV